jgi:hypothetical protein
LVAAGAENPNAAISASMPAATASGSSRITSTPSASAGCLYARAVTGDVR